MADETTQTKPPASEPKAVPAKKGKKEPEIGATYHGGGELNFTGVPMKDLSVRELLDLKPATINRVTAPNPTTGDAVYVLTPAGEKALKERYADA